MLVLEILRRKRNSSLVRESLTCYRHKLKCIIIGKVLINGRTVAVNVDFARQAIFIAEQLDCSERYAASLLQDVMTEYPNYTQEQCLEATILQFHLRRRHLADCLRYIFEATEVAETTEAPQFYRRLAAFVRQQLLPSVGGPGRLSLFSKIFQEIHNIGTAIDKVQTTRQNAGSNTVPPTAQCSKSISGWLFVTSNIVHRWCGCTWI